MDREDFMDFLARFELEAYIHKGMELTAHLMESINIVTMLHGAAHARPGFAGMDISTSNLQEIGLALVDCMEKFLQKAVIVPPDEDTAELAMLKAESSEKLDWFRQALLANGS